MDESQSLFDRCCEKCTHSVETPCDDWLACRTAGPFCHSDESCRSGRVAIARRTAFGPGTLVGVPQGDCGRGQGAGEIYASLRWKLDPERFEVVRSGCLGACYAEPVIWVLKADEPLVIYAGIEPEELDEFIELLDSGELPKDKVMMVLNPPLRDEVHFQDNRHLYTIDDISTKLYPWFLDKQMRLVTPHAGLARPTSLEDYIMRGGLHPLYIMLKNLNSEEAFSFLDEARLVSRRTGKSAGEEWQEFADSEVDTLLLDLTDSVANPPLFTRRLLEATPFAVLESLMLLGRLTGAKKAIIRLPDDWGKQHKKLKLPDTYQPTSEIPIENLQLARHNLVEQGLLEATIPGSDFAMSVELVTKPPPKNEKMLRVELETSLNLLSLTEMGGEWFSGFGHGRASGTKCFTIVGSSKAWGHCEVNLGTPLADVLDLVCGGGAGSVTGVTVNGKASISHGDFSRSFDFPPKGAKNPADELFPPWLLQWTAEAVSKQPKYTAKRRGSKAEKTADEAEHPFAFFLAEYRRFNEDDLSGTPQQLAWRLVGQSLERLVLGNGEAVELLFLARWAQYLKGVAPEAISRWAGRLQSGIHLHDDLLYKSDGEGLR